MHLLFGPHVRCWFWNTRKWLYLRVTNAQFDHQETQILGYTILLPNQHKAIKSFIEGHDVCRQAVKSRFVRVSVLPNAFDYGYPLDAS